MSYISINSNEINTGEPVSNTTQSKIKDNFDNLNNRVTSLEGGSSTVYPPLVLNVNGDYFSMAGAKGVLTTTLNFNLTVTGVRLLIDKAGSSGTTQIDIEYKRGAGSWTSILSTKPSLSYTDGDNAISTDGVLNPGEVDLEAGDKIRLNISSAQAHASGLMARIDFSKT